MVGSAGPYTLLIGLFLLTAILGQLISVPHAHRYSSQSLTKRLWRATAPSLHMGVAKAPLCNFIATAVAEKVAALMTVEYLRDRAKRGSLEKFEAVLAKVPDVEPEPHDRL